MSEIGFLATHTTRKNQSMQDSTTNSIFSFDSGKSISIKDAKLHTLILGTTGTGKTASVLLPMLYGVLKANECGLIIDIKGNLREQVRYLAKKVDRHADIFEYGLSDTAIPINIIDHMNLSDYQNFLESLVENSYDGKSNNKDFRIRGVAQCISIHQFMKIVAKKKNQANPTLKDLYDMITRPRKAGKFFEKFIKKYYNKKNKIEKRLVDEVHGDAFHIFHFTNSDYAQHRVYHEQLNYAIDSVRTALEQVFLIKNLEEKFACKGAAGINFKENFYQNRIAVLRFTPGSGKVGNIFSRLFITKYYESVFSFQPKEIAKYPSFVCIDEFQEVAVLNGEKRFSDTAFVAQAREFSASFIASTQSASSLLCNVNNNEQNVNSFISNCNTKIFFRTDDPLTQKVVENYSQVQLNELEPSYAYVNLYSDIERKPSFSKESVNNSYEIVQDLLNNEEYAVSHEEILETNETLENILKREMQRNLEAEKNKALLTKNAKQKKKKEKSKIRKIYDKFEPDECKIQLQAFMGTYTHYIEDDCTRLIYIPLSWQEGILKAFKEFEAQKITISIQDVIYNKEYNCLAVKVFKEVKNEEIILSLKAEKALNSLLIKHRKKYKNLNEAENPHCENPPVEVFEATTIKTSQNAKG